MKQQSDKARKLYIEQYIITTLWQLAVAMRSAKVQLSNPK